MRILVYPHELSIGGSQINAIDLAAALVDRGHEVMVYGIKGPLVEHIERRGLRFLPANRSERRPALGRIRELRRHCQAESVDLVHAYEWPSCLDAYFGAHLLDGVPLLCTELSMSTSSLVPPSVPLVMGTRELQEKAVRSRPAPVDLLEPPVDVERDRPDIDVAEFRRLHGVRSTATTVAVVSRLSLDLKLDSLERALDAVGALAAEFDVQLLVVGGGEAEAALRRRAGAINNHTGRPTVIMTGPLLDPRPAYATADVVVGMGSSILRAMAFAKPVVVQGAAGFSQPFDEETKELFLWQGFYGTGDGRPGSERLQGQLRELLTAPERRRMLGDLSRSLVLERFSLERAAEHLEAICLRATGAVSQGQPRMWLEAAVMASRAIVTEAQYHTPAQRSRNRSRRARIEAAAKAAT